MNTKKLATLSTLAGGVLLILALFRGRVSQLLLIAYLCLWTIVWVIGWVRDTDDTDRKEERKPSILARWLARTETPEESNDGEPADRPDPYDGLLLQHVEARITELLRLAYPQAEWQWCEEDPESVIREGGAARIRTKNTGVYRDATLSFEEPGDLHLEFIETAPLRDLLAHAQVAEPSVPQGEPVQVPAPAEVPVPEPVTSGIVPAEPREEDVNLWYSLIGQKALTELITELNIRQCSQITIDPDGDVYFREAISIHRFSSLNILFSCSSVKTPNATNVLSNIPPSSAQFPLYRCRLPALLLRSSTAAELVPIELLHAGLLLHYPMWNIH